MKESEEKKMKLFDVKHIDLDIGIKDKVETLQHLTHLMKECLLDEEKYIADVIEREKLSTTGIGDGIAIPHAKSAWVKTVTVAVGKSNTGIEWESLDEKPAHLIFLIAVPENGENEHLKILQKLAINLMDEDFKKSLENARSSKEMERLLNEKIF